MDFTLSKEHEMARQLFKEFAENEVKPLAQEVDETETFPRETVEKMAKYGFMGIPVPKEYGGQGCDTLTYAMCVEELSKVCATTGVIVSAHTSLCIDPIMTFGTEDQKKKYVPDLASGRKIGAFGLTEPGAGTDAQGQQTKAVLDGDEWVINGSKCFITSAAPSIVNGIRALERQGVDVMIVGRGGGSIEDLWAFNERMVAQAVFDCSVPIISAVGHETDTTIIDYVADLRAPTPSAAAELAVTQVSDIENEILDRQDRLYQRMGRVLQHKRQQADQMEMRLKYLSPASRIREKRTYSIQLEDRLQNRLQAILRERRHNLALYIERMKAVSPLEKLNSGFSYVEDTDGKNIRSVIQVEAGERLRIRVSDGVIDTRVEQIQKEERLPG